MMEVRYQTPDGRELHRQEWNRHHVQFQRNIYRSPAERKFREMGGLVLPLWVAAHGDLRAAVPPPPKPNPDLMRDIYCFGRNVEHTDRYDQFYKICDFLLDIVDNSATQQHVEDATLLLTNYTQQMPFIEQGRIERIQDGRLSYS